jgi:hypothetical protein
MRMSKENCPSCIVHCANKTAENSLRYFNLRKSGNSIVADIADDYVSLPNSVIEDAGDMLLRRVTEVAAANAGVKPR